MADQNFDHYLQEKIITKPGLADDLEKFDRALEIAFQIYSLRKHKGLTQTDLAKKIKVSQSNIARIENADYTHYTLKTLHKVAKGLGADLNIFINKPEQTVKLITAFKGEPIFQSFTISKISGRYIISGGLTLNSEGLYDIPPSSEYIAYFENKSTEADTNKFYYQNL